MWFSYHSRTIFAHFGRWNISCYLRGVLGGSWGRFSELLGWFWLDFKALKRSLILKPKLEAEKVVPRSRGGTGGWVWRPLILVNDQSIHDIDARPKYFYRAFGRNDHATFRAQGHGGGYCIRLYYVEIYLLILYHYIISYHMTLYCIMLALYHIEFLPYLLWVKKQNETIKFSQVVREPMGNHRGGQRRALQKFDSSKITKIDISTGTKKLTFKNRSNSLLNDPINIFRGGRASSNCKKYLNSKFCSQVGTTKIIYIYTHIYIYTYICIYTYIHVYIYIYIL